MKPTTVVWHSLFKEDAQQEGLVLTRQIWQDMRTFDGYIGHEIYIDQENPCYIIQVGHWQTRADADNVREKYKDSPVIAKLTPLLAKPRERFITKAA